MANLFPKLFLAMVAEDTIPSLPPPLGLELKCEAATLMLGVDVGGAHFVGTGVVTIGVGCGDGAVADDDPSGEAEAEELPVPELLFETTSPASPSPSVLVLGAAVESVACVP